MAKYLDEIGVKVLWEKAKNAQSGRVGDIKITKSSDVGEGWLLCNGDIVDKNNYPELCELISGNPEGDFTAAHTGNANYGNAVVYGNGYYVFFKNFRRSPNVGSQNPQYTSELGGALTTFTLSFAPFDIKFINGKFVAVGYVENVTKIAVFDTPVGDVTYYDIYTSSVTYSASYPTYPISIDYVNGKYIVSLSYYDGSKLRAAILHADTVDGTWTFKYFDETASKSKGYAFAFNAVYYKGYYVVLAAYQVTTEQDDLYIYYSTDLETFSKKLLLDNHAANYTAHYGMATNEDTLVIVYGGKNAGVYALVAKDELLEFEKVLIDKTITAAGGCAPIYVWGGYYYTSRNNSSSFDGTEEMFYAFNPEGWIVNAGMNLGAVSITNDKIFISASNKVYYKPLIGTLPIANEPYGYVYIKARV